MAQPVQPPPPLIPPPNSYHITLPPVPGVPPTAADVGHAQRYLSDYGRSRTSQVDNAPMLLPAEYGAVVQYTHAVAAQSAPAQVAPPWAIAMQNIIQEDIQGVRRDLRRVQRQVQNVRREVQDVRREVQDVRRGLRRDLRTIRDDLRSVKRDVAIMGNRGKHDGRRFNFARVPNEQGIYLNAAANGVPELVDDTTIQNLTGPQVNVWFLHYFPGPPPHSLAVRKARIAHEIGCTVFEQ
ncbi:hypothetical protein GYMLUDRAFT_86916 [Collybiopsis luxurians FD-317 M1]|uniref:Mug135-like C-terminal domain-containing protein n=1 Tax=Collybiopsis luxurians FD-317 M1 TaxID=944289 RepID=A0A0D0CG87_9AGAR|nr:hypothetical protein GYMLUDRAFT_86916 [Collybiopsis luxurians FD-317 M1]